MADISIRNATKRVNLAKRTVMQYHVTYTAAADANSAFLMSFYLRVVPRFRGNVNINKPLAACNGTSTQYMLFSAINGRVLVLIYFKSFHLISPLETCEISRLRPSGFIPVITIRTAGNATLRHICLRYCVLCLRVVPRFQRRLAGTLIHCVLWRKQTFRSSAGPRFTVIGLL